MYLPTQHPALQPTLSRVAFLIITVLRAIFFSTLVAVLDPLIDFGTAVWLLATACIIGTVIGSTLAFTSLRTLGFILLGVFFFCSYQLIFAVLSSVFFSSAGNPFPIYSTLQHFNLLFIFLCVTALSTWAFWKLEQAASAEILILASTCIYLLSGHRNYHFDTPALINELAWSFNVGHLTMIVMLGVFTVVLCAAYLFFVTSPARPMARFGAPIVLAHRNRQSALLRLLGWCALCLLVVLISNQVYTHFNASALSRTANGVGQDNKEGLSPLDFHSALGTTNQPSALVRLEGDYSSNPFTPMMYLRESALSEFNGNEFVLA